MQKEKNGNVFSFFQLFTKFKNSVIFLNELQEKGNDSIFFGVKFFFNIFVKFS